MVLLALREDMDLNTDMVAAMFLDMEATVMDLVEEEDTAMDINMVATMSISNFKEMTTKANIIVVKLI